MKKISKTDTVFQFCTNEDGVLKSDVSYYGWEFSILHCFKNYIEGYKLAVEAAFFQFVESGKKHDISKQDTIIYPIVFLYRHITELYLKYIYLTLNETSESELTTFLNQNHNLKGLYNSLKDALVFYSKRVGYMVDISALDHYIESIDVVDPKSMSFRYPVNKNLDRFQSSACYLNIDNLHNKMNSFFEYLDFLVSRVSEQLDRADYNEGFNKWFLDVLELSKDKIKALFEYHEENRKAEKNKNEINKKVRWLQLSDSPSMDNEDIAAENNYLKSFSEDQKTVLLLLYYAGRTYKSGQNNFAVEKEERKRDLLKLLYRLRNESISTGGSSRDNILRDKIFGSTFAKDNINSVLDIRL